MGLEIVEITMQAEDEFGIAIPGESVPKVATVGDFYDLVMKLINESESSKLRGRIDLERYVWSRVTQMMAEESPGLRSEQIMRETRLIEDLGFG